MGKINLNEVEISGEIYVKKSAAPKMAESTNGLTYAVICSTAGTFVGYVKEVKGTYACLVQARRVYSWSGAATVQQMAMDGVKNPNNCKFVAPVPKQEIFSLSGITPCTEKAKESLEGVPIWEI